MEISALDWTWELERKRKTHPIIECFQNKSEGVNCSAESLES